MRGTVFVKTLSPRPSQKLLGYGVRYFYLVDHRQQEAPVRIVPDKGWGCVLFNLSQVGYVVNATAVGRELASVPTSPLLGDLYSFLPRRCNLKRPFPIERMNGYHNLWVLEL